MLRSLLGLVALATVACSTPTQLVLVVDTDMQPVVEVATIRVSATDSSAGSDTRDFDLSTVELPFSLGVRPSRSDDAPIVIGAAAIGPDGNVLTTMERMTHFVPGEARVVELPLARACAVELSCNDEGMTCVRGECVGTDIDPTTLPLAGGDDLHPLFDGPRVAPDAGTHADAGIACIEDAPCDTGDPCRLGRTVCEGAPRCELAEMMAAGTDCGNGRTCTADGRCAP